MRGFSYLKPSTRKWTISIIIYVGQQVKLPDVTLRNQAWYQSLFDKAGQIKNELLGSSLSPSTLTPAKVTSIVKTPGDPITETAAILDGKLLNRGTYFFPRKGKEDFELDLSRFPVIELKDGSRIIFADKKNASNTDLSLLQSLWEKVNVIEVEKDTPVDTILGAVFQDTAKEITQTEISFSDNGMDVVVTAKWIKPSPAEEDGTVRYTCISSIEDPHQITSDAIVRYLDQHLVTIKDILDREVGTHPPESSTASSTPFVLPDVVTLTPIKRKAFVKRHGRSHGKSVFQEYYGQFPLRRNSSRGHIESCFHG